MNKIHLPQGWCISTISDISIKGEQRKPSGEESFIYVDIGSINRNLKFIESPQTLIGENAPSRARKVINTGDVLVSLTRPNLNAVALVPSELDNQIASTGFEVIKSLLVDSRYIFMLTRSKDFIDSISGVVQGALYPAAKSSDVQAYKFPLPPLAEQKVITDKLDILLAQVEATKARLERIPDILKTLRQSVITAAVSGKLTEGWRELNKQNLGMWKHGVLGDFVEKPTYGSSAKSQPEGLVPVLRMGNLQDGKIDWTSLAYTSDPEEIKKYKLFAGDVLFNRTNSPELVGKTSIFRGEREAVYAGYLIRIKCKENLNPEFLNYILNSQDAKDYCYQVKSDGVSQSNINAQKLIAYTISVPSMVEQTEIVRRIEGIFSFADNIKLKTSVALERVNNLTQSILAKAFRGELSADWRAANPELIRGDNSAKALLKKIQAQREAIVKQPKTTIKKKADSRMSKKIIKVVEALKHAGEPLSGQQLLAAAGYPSDSSTEQLEQFFLDIRDALVIEESIVKLDRGDDSQDWFTLAKLPMNKAKN
ncbi:TPA: restriction endonuclease subunit S [Klebsiella pneumoniae]